VKDNDETHLVSRTPHRPAAPCGRSWGWGGAWWNRVINQCVSRAPTVDGPGRRRGQKQNEGQRNHIYTWQRWTLSHCSIAYWQPQETHRGEYPPGAAHGSAFRSQNKVLRVLRFCPMRPNLYRPGPDVRPEPRHKPCAARSAPRPRTRCVIGTQKAPRGPAS